MPKYELLLATKVLTKPGYEAVIKAICRHIWSQDGAVKKIESMGTRNFPHAQNLQTRFGVLKIWKGTYFQIDVIVPSSTISELSRIGLDHDEIVFVKAVKQGPNLPVWCGYREKQNERYAQGLERRELFD